jgi:hypothetical protein
MSVSTSSSSLNGGGAPVTPVGTFAQPRKRPSDAALDAVMMKKVRTRESADGTRNLEVDSSSVVMPFHLPAWRQAKLVFFFHFY